MFVRILGICWLIRFDLFELLMIVRVDWVCLDRIETPSLMKTWVLVMKVNF